MKVQTIGSGSKGNSTIVLCGDIKLIIDIGLSYLQVKRSLEKLNLSYEDFTGILITHSHNDHIKGLVSIIKKTKLSIFIPKEMYPELKEIVPIDRCVFIEDKDKIRDINISLIHTSHDTDYSVGFIIEHNNKSLLYVTDTGYINRKFLKQMKNKNIYIIESNHDEEMLMNGPYPRFLKERVISDRGHLSNKTAARYLKQSIGNNTKYIILAHISEKNNTEELAYQETSSMINNDNIKIIVAKQNEESELLEV